MTTEKEQKAAEMLHEAFGGLSHADWLRTQAQNTGNAAMTDIVGVELVQEDPRLFIDPLEPKWRGCVASSQKGLRLNAWFPFEDRYWPFSNTFDQVVLPRDTLVLMLERHYLPNFGRFEFKIGVLNNKIESGLRPGKTKLYRGFMVADARSAMAALLIPANAEDPID